MFIGNAKLLANHNHRQLDRKRIDKIATTCLNKSIDQFVTYLLHSRHQRFHSSRGKSLIDETPIASMRRWVLRQHRVDSGPASFLYFSHLFVDLIRSHRDGKSIRKGFVITQNLSRGFEIRNEYDSRVRTLVYGRFSSQTRVVVVGACQYLWRQRNCLFER